MRKSASPGMMAVRLLRSASLICTLALLFIAANTTTTYGQSQSSRPVARLISSSRAVIPSDTRPMRMDSHASSSETKRSSAASFAGATSLERRAFELINAERMAQGQTPFVWDAELSRMARQHSESMATRNFFDHTGPDGRDMITRAHSCNIRGWSALAENIAYNQGFNDPASFAVERWMHSAKHRDNVMSRSFTRSAIGVARASDGRIFFTQVFIAR